jgi:hypothetical protein
MTKPFNITLVQPAGYVHSLALAEAIEYLRIQLVAAGHSARVSRNELDLGAYNVIACGHLLGDQHHGRLPADSIIFNSEPLTDAAGWQFKSGAYRRLLAAHHVWDYSPVNLAHLGHDRASVIPFLYCAELARPAAAWAPGDALLFYGAITPYRQRVLDELRARGIAVDVVFGYGATRDARMLRSRAVLNLHKSEDRSTFEPIRCFYPLINGVPVFSEATTDPAADAFRDSTAFVDDLAELATATPIDASRFRATSPTAPIASAVAAFLRT